MKRIVKVVRNGRAEVVDSSNTKILTAFETVFRKLN